MIETTSITVAWKSRLRRAQRERADDEGQHRTGDRRAEQRQRPWQVPAEDVGLERRRIGLGERQHGSDVGPDRLEQDEREVHDAAEPELEVQGPACDGVDAEIDEQRDQVGLQRDAHRVTSART